MSATGDGLSKTQSGAYRSTETDAATPTRKSHTPVAIDDASAAVTEMKTDTVATDHVTRRRPHEANTRRIEAAVSVRLRIVWPLRVSP